MRILYADMESNIIFFALFTLFHVSNAAFDRFRGNKCQIGRSFCVRSVDCSPVSASTRNEKLTICGMQSGEIMVCCPYPDYRPKKKRSEKYYDSSLTVSQRYCKKIHNAIPCDTNAIPEVGIVNGVSSKPKQFPHMALIGFGNTFDEVNWACGGSLISESYVLSAAHCATHNTMGDARWIRLGELDYESNTDGADPHNFTIVERIVHPGYKPPAVYNDLVLFKLHRRAVFNDFIQPICLNDAQFSMESPLVVSGWGQRGYGETNSSILLHVNVNEVEYDTCRGVYKPDAEFPNGIDKRGQICAGDYLEGGKDACGGDSGGPLQYIFEDAECSSITSYLQVGVVGLGRGCGLKKSSGVYTRVSHYIPWIERNVWKS